MDRKTALAGSKAPQWLLDRMTLLSVEHYDLDFEIRTGQLVVRRELSAEVKGIFTWLRARGFPIASIIPISQFDWDDDASMAANNTSCFNYRLIADTNCLSNHAEGVAIDINPVFNPYDSRSGAVLPPGAVYDPRRPGTFARTIRSGALAIELFEAQSWLWLGDRVEYPDRHHFEKIGYEPFLTK